MQQLDNGHTPTGMPPADEMPPSKPPSTSSKNIVSPQKNHPSLLESLPSELGLAILKDLRPNSLQSLIRASPTYLALYSANQLSIMRHQLSTLLGPALIDAAGAVLDATSGKWYYEQVNAFLRSSYPETCISNLSVWQCLRLIHTHTQHIEPYVTKYADWALRNMRDLEGGKDPIAAGHSAGCLSSPRTQMSVYQTAGLGWKPGQGSRRRRGQAKSMTQTEKMRITHSFYRLLLLDRFDLSQRRLHMLNLESLQRRWALWEWEGICCVNEYFLSKQDARAAFKQKCSPTCCITSWQTRRWGGWCTDFLLQGGCGEEEEDVQGVEPAPKAWGWTDGMILTTGMGDEEQAFGDYWGMIGYVHWDDERMIEWARKVGKREMKKMGFLGKGLRKDVFPGKVEDKGDKDCKTQ